MKKKRVDMIKVESAFKNSRKILRKGKVDQSGSVVSVVCSPRVSFCSASFNEFALVLVLFFLFHKKNLHGYVLCGLFSGFLFFLISFLKTNWQRLEMTFTTKSWNWKMSNTTWNTTSDRRISKYYPFFFFFICIFSYDFKSKYLYYFVI